MKKKKMKRRREKGRRETRARRFLKHLTASAACFSSSVCLNKPRYYTSEEEKERRGALVSRSAENERERQGEALRMGRDGEM